MPTVLENYYNLRSEVDKRIAQGNVSADAIWWHGELVYRIGVLETCQMFCKTAPICLETNILQGHYQMLDAYVQSLALERRYGPNRGPDTQKERDAAQTNLGRVIEDYRKRFSSFAPSAPESYSHEIGRVVQTLLPAWLQFRNTFVPLKKKEKEATADSWLHIVMGGYTLQRGNLERSLTGLSC